MPRIINKPPPRLSNPQIETAGKAAEKARRGGKPTVDETIRNTFLPGTADPRALERLNGPSGTPVPAAVRDIYATNAPSVFSALDGQHGFLPVRMPTREELAGAAKIDFGRTGSPVAGEVRAGGKLAISYDVDRSQVQENHGSTPAWGVTAFVELQPSGKRIEAPAVAFRDYAGRIDPRPVSVPLLIDVPPGCTGVTVWFKQHQGADHPRTEWDSNYGQNYRFDVKPNSR